MAFNAQVPVEQSPIQKVQIYSSSSNEISPFWRDKYEKQAKKYWDVFYKRHQDKFFKDRHYLDKEWHRYFYGEERKVILEIGCGAGNTVFPLVATYPNLFVHACDFSPRAVNLVKSHKDFKDSQINAFVCDLTIDDLSQQITLSSVDVVTMIFVLSAVSPEKMPLVLQNVRKVLKPNGYVLFRDYATGDLAQERFSCKDQKISKNFYVRGDGTRAFYFSNEFLASLFEENGFSVKELGVCCKQVENRSRGLVMNRRWIQAAFHFTDSIKPFSTLKAAFDETIFPQSDIGSEIEEENLESSVDDTEFDMSEGVATDMFGDSASNEHEIMEIDVRGWSFKIKVLLQENQHICKSTGLILWESSRLMASVLARNPSIVSQKRVLELGCGCGGICSMVAAQSADLVVATDGDEKALNLLAHNVSSNLSPPLLPKLIRKRLEWGNKDQIEAIKEVSDYKGYDIILGTDVTYIPEAILPLFATARELIASKKGGGEEDCDPALILCHVVRRVDEPTILSAASQFGFRLDYMWRKAGRTESEGVLGSWFSEKAEEDYIPSTALNIMYFTVNQ